MRNFKHVDEHHSFQLDNRQIAYLGTGVLALFLLFFLLGVLYGGRLGGVRSLAASSGGTLLFEPELPAEPAVAPAPKAAVAPAAPNERVFRIDEEEIDVAEALALEPPSAAIQASPAAKAPAKEPPQAAEPVPARPAQPAQAVRPAAPVVGLRGAQLSAMAGPYTIQVGSFTRAEDAKRLSGQLEAKGYPAFLARGEVRGQTYYRVRLGRFANREQAVEQAQRFERTEKLDTYVTQAE